MATVVAIAYPDQHTAENARATVWQLEEELIMQAEEVAVISRDLDGKYHVHTSHTGFSTAGGAIWGGTSALFMMIEHVTPDKAIAALDQYGGTVIKASLSDEDAKKLQDALQPRSTTARS